MDEHHRWYNWSVWYIDLPCQVHISQWPIFYDPVILLHILKNYLMEKCCTWDNGSVWLKDQPCKIYVCQWPIFHSPLILSYIIVHTCQISRHGENLMIFPPILWSYGGDANLTDFRHIWFILGHCGQKQANFMRGYDLGSLTCLKINTFSSAILLIETFSKWNSHLYANSN